MTTFLTDEDILHCIRRYISCGEQQDLVYLTPDVVPEKYRVLPKNGWLFRGEQRVLSDHPTKSVMYIGSGFKSFTTSANNAKDFARGICGNDYFETRHYRTRGHRHPLDKRYGIMYRHRPTLDEIVLSIGKFLRAADKEHEFKAFRHENEYLLKVPMATTIHKENILWVTDKVVVD